MTRGKEIYMTGTMDKASFEALFRKFFPALMAFSLKYLPDEDDAREVVHNVFINLWDKRATLDASQSLKSYLFTAVHNRSLNVLRDRRKFSDEDMPELSSEENVHAQMESVELEEHINAVIAGLPDKCREIFELNRFDGLKYGEIAEKLGISVKTVENQMSKALRILREKLAHYLSLIVWILWNGIN